MSHPVIPIVDEDAAAHACAGRQPLVVVPLRCTGEAARVRALLAALAREAAGLPELLPPDTPLQAWVRELHLVDGEATLVLAAELGCRGHALASLCFDVMRLRLHDTDVYVHRLTAPGCAGG